MASNIDLIEKGVFYEALSRGDAAMTKIVLDRNNISYQMVKNAHGHNKYSLRFYVAILNHDDLNFQKAHSIIDKDSSLIALYNNERNLFTFLED